MIATLHGKLETLREDEAIINVGGIGFRVYMPASTLSTLDAIGSEVNLYTHFALREDNAALYGFASTGELEMFQQLLTISGLGPRLALAMLSSMSLERLTTAIASGSSDVLTEIPGIGKKTANRLILELKDKISAGWMASPAARQADENADVITTLTSLGYSTVEASRAVASLPLDSKLSLEERVKQALAYFTVG